MTCEEQLKNDLRGPRYHSTPPTHRFSSAGNKLSENKDQLLQSAGTHLLQEAQLARFNNNNITVIQLETL